MLKVHAYKVDACEIYASGMYVAEMYCGGVDTTPSMVWRSRVGYLSS
jgi:hypothetical protein